MVKLHEKIMKLRFRRAAKILIALVLAVSLIGGISSAALLSPQINEAIVYARTSDETERAQGETDAVLQTDGEHGQEKRRSEHRDWENIPFSEPSAAAKIAVGVTAAFLLALGAAYWLLCAVWLYRAAALAGMNRWFWFVLALACNLAAIALFLMVRWALHTKCPQCGTWQRRGHYCANCRAELVHYCPSCGTTISVKDLYCQHCGVSLKKE